MDKILLGIIQSSHPEGLKKQLISQVTNAAGKSQPEDTVVSILDIALRIILFNKNSLENELGKDVFRIWAKSNSLIFQAFLTPNKVHELMLEPTPKPQNIVWVLHESFLILQSMGSSNLEKLGKAVETESISFVRENRKFEVISSYARFLLDFRECIPRSEYTSLFCISLINVVSVFYGTNVHDLKSYVSGVSNAIGGLLSHIWLHTDKECILTCLRTIFQLISYVNETDIDVSPSWALGGIVQHVPEDLMATVVKTTVEDASISDRRMIVALERMMDWLSWPGARNIDLWIISFLKGLAAVHKYTILIEVTECIVETVYDKLHIPLIRNGAFNVLSVLLLSFQHSPEAFHKIAPNVPNTVLSLRREYTKESHKFLFRFSELVHCLMYLHPGFPDLYEPILDVVKDLPKPTPEKMKAMLSRNKWNAQQSASQVAGSSIDVLRQKSETEKTGLVNLGNTCYMNSVLQALYMCDSFRRNVLSSSVNEHSGLLLKLQQSFAFLSTSQRAAYAPSPFLATSRPPWFTPGCQQDCSEFLRYLLDQLHEQQLTHLRRQQAEHSVKEREKTPPTPEKTSKWKLRSRDKNGKSSPRPVFQSDDDKLQPTLTQQTFGGKIMTTYKCMKCKCESSRCENFTDLPLAFPERNSNKKTKRQALMGGDQSQAGNEMAKNQGTDSRELLQLEDLIEYYLKPEKLEGENKYHCDNCKGLQDGERTIKIIDSPEYLILTLLRFAYDTKRQSRSKIFTDVRYPKTIYLPVQDEEPNSVQATGTLKRLKISKSPPHSPAPGPKGADRLDVYSLGAVVVHSGLSSDGGHYYCYARHCIPINQSDLDSQQANNSIDNIDYLQDKWYLFNDSRVTYSSYESFCNVTQKFSRDTAYVLVYKKICPEDLASGTVGANENIMPAARDPPLRDDLRKMVDKDNKLYLQEQELQQRSRAMKKSSVSAAWYTNWKDHDENGPPGSCGGGFGGLSGSRLVF